MSIYLGLIDELFNAFDEKKLSEVEFIQRAKSLFGPEGFNFSQELLNYLQNDSEVNFNDYDATIELGHWVYANIFNRLEIDNIYKQNTYDLFDCIWSDEQEVIDLCISLFNKIDLLNKDLFKSIKNVFESYFEVKREKLRAGVEIYDTVLGSYLCAKIKKLDVETLVKYCLETDDFMLNFLSTDALLGYYKKLRNNYVEDEQSNSDSSDCELIRKFLITNRAKELEEEYWSKNPTRHFTDMIYYMVEDSWPLSCKHISHNFALAIFDRVDIHLRWLCNSSSGRKNISINREDEETIKKLFDNNVTTSNYFEQILQVSFAEEDGLKSFIESFDDFEFKNRVHLPGFDNEYKRLLMNVDSKKIAKDLDYLISCETHQSKYVVFITRYLALKIISSMPFHELKKYSDYIYNCHSIWHEDDNMLLGLNINKTIRALYSRLLSL